MNTLHIETGRNLYGGALQVVHLVRGLAARGQKATVLCTAGSGIEQELNDQPTPGVAVRPVQFAFSCDPTFVLRATRVIHEEKPDIVHLHSRRGGDFFGGLAAGICKVPAVVLSRRVDDPISRNLWNHVRFRLLCDHVIAISEGIRSVLLKAGLPEDRVSMVHSAIDTSLYRIPRDGVWFRSEFGVDEHETTLGVVAQLIERKGHAYLLRAMPGILKSFPLCKLLFFGKGPAENDLRKLIMTLDLQDRVIIAGFREDMPRIFPNLDLLIHPALTEGLGVSLLQAAASGVPIIAAKTGGIPEIITDGKTGWLVPPADARAIEEAVCFALNNPELAKRLADNALERVESEFALDSMVEGNLRVYREVLQRSNPNTVHFSSLSPGGRGRM